MSQLKLGISSDTCSPLMRIKYLKDYKCNSLSLGLKICSDICIWTLSVPLRSQFSESKQMETIVYVKSVDGMKIKNSTQDLWA